jgi:hypothetical protein
MLRSLTFCKTVHKFVKKLTKSYILGKFNLKNKHSLSAHSLEFLHCLRIGEDYVRNQMA